jgi:hypothetical protein
MSGSSSPGPVGTGNFGVNLTTGILEQYTPPTVTSLGNSATIGQQQTIAADGTLAAGNWQIISGGPFTATAAAVVAPITIA